MAKKVYLYKESTLIQGFNGELKLRYPKVANLIFHIPNEGKKTIQARMRAKREGVRAGVWDEFLPLPSNGYHGLWIEWKIPGAKLTKAQREWGEMMLALGYECVVVDNIEDGIKTIENYVPKGYLQ